MNKRADKRQDVFIVGIAGGSGSGKSTFARSLMKAFERHVALISCDNYYRANDTLTQEERQQLNFDAPEALELDLMASHIHALKRGESVEAPLYDFSLHTRRKETQRILPKPIIIVDGILILSSPSLRKCFDLKIYVEADADERILRRVRRDMRERGRKIDDIMTQYLTTVKPMHNQYVEPSKVYADLIINGGMNPVALDVVKARLSAFLSKRNAKER